MNLRDINREFKGNTKLPVSTCVRNMKPSSSLKILYPAAFHLKEEGVLAAHPPSCHPWRVFGYLENERKGKEARALKASCQKEILLIEKIPITVFAWAYILSQNNTNYQNQQKNLTITRTKWEEIKRGTKINKSNG